MTIKTFCYSLIQIMIYVVTCICMLIVQYNSLWPDATMFVSDIILGASMCSIILIAIHKPNSISFIMSIITLILSIVSISL